MQTEDSKGSLKLLAAIVFVYIVLFEFILPINKFLPKPSLLFESIVHIWRDYNLLYALTSTSTIIFLSLILGYLSAYLNVVPLITFYERRRKSIEALGIFKYIPVIVIVSAFYFWFSEHLFAEILFVLLAACFMTYNSLIRNSENVKDEYVHIAKNLGLNPSEIYEKVFWRSIQPKIMIDLLKIHLRLWGLVLLFEFVTNFYGIGHVVRSIINYGDFTGLFNIFILVSLLIWAGDSVIRIIRTKFVFWEA